MEEFEVLLGLLVIVTILVTLARRVHIPYPILLVLGGLVLGFIPGLPHIELSPDIVFVLFLPPLIQSAAYFTSIRDFRANLRSITLLAVGLPLFTMTVVAIVTYMAIPNLPLEAAFVLGAIVSPPDAVAVTAVASSLRVPRRVITVLEGESLVNDATALVAYRFAVAAVVTGAFSPFDAGLSFLLSGGGGVIVGVIVARSAVEVLKRIQDPPIEILITLLVAFGNYLLAEQLGFSGVLALVAGGLYLGRNDPAIISSETRLQARAVWEMVTFLLNGLVFILIGLQLNSIVMQLRETNYSITDLIWYAVVISLAVMIARIVWMYPGALLPHVLSKKVRENEERPPWQNVTVVAWAGMRGMVSLAAALALPLQTANGAPFPERTLILFLTFCIILVTLVLQGLSLPALIRALKLDDDDGGEREERTARLHAAKAGAARLEQLANESTVSAEMIDDLRSHYVMRKSKYRKDDDGAREDRANQLGEVRRFKRELLQAERAAVIGLRDGGTINDEVMRRVEREIDLEDQRLGT